MYLDEITDADEANNAAMHSSAASAEDGMRNDEIRVAFHQALEALTPEHRQTLMLREVEGLSYKEIAETMQCRMGTVMSRIFYARKQIQQKLRAWK